MDDPRDAEDATRELDGSRMCGRRVKVSFCLLFLKFCFPPSLLVPPERYHIPPSSFRFLNRLGNFSEDRSSFKPAKKNLKFSCLDLPASLPFPSLHSPPTLIKLVCPSQALKERKPTKKPLCLAAYQAKLPNKQVRRCCTLPKIRVFCKPLNFAPLCHLCPSGPDEQACEEPRWRRSEL